MEKFRQMLKNLDIPLISAVCILCVIGIVLVSSATASFSGGKTQVIIQTGAFLLTWLLPVFGFYGLRVFGIQIPVYYWY